MGKKSLLVSSSKKISSSKDDKKQLSSLLKVLRPKVYITDSSSFKNLVQHLTGNGNGNDPIPLPTSSSSSSIQPPLLPLHHHHHHDQDHHQIFQGSSSTSLDLSSVDDSPQLNMPFESSPEASMPAPLVDFSQFRDVESWLLEIDQFPNYNYYDHGYAADLPSVNQEVCVYDYEYNYDLSGLI
ncbi:hypothetical protein HYC85_015121 [Camellia sinensis]|uniref:VQ domain-containing protein n=1 Tax=Camellia sinensis TaxID=4442 RepID=A0A7J7HBB0_CAMSI|nr:hypothetical protein HYC85_015121 [Camellia sinensis]